MAKNSGLLGIRKKSDSIKSIKPDYISNFDYEKHEVLDLRQELVVSEEIIMDNITNIGKATFEIAEHLYSVNQKLASRGNGTYMAWCTSLGINKDRSSVLLKKYSLYLQTNKKEVMELPIPVVKSLTSKSADFTNDDVIKIVEAEKPSFIFKEIEKRYSQVANKSESKIIEAEIVESEEEKLEGLKKELAFIERDIKERERNLKKRYEDRKEVLKRIEGIEVK